MERREPLALCWPMLLWAVALVLVSIPQAMPLAILTDGLSELAFTVMSLLRIGQTVVPRDSLYPSRPNTLVNTPGRGYAWVPQAHGCPDCHRSGSRSGQVIQIAASSTPMI
ncbi:hypothetical protein [Streptosporangium sp. KLBMP 9127]|nr:hypothetical protein [Streptosporangium sp. KLBMP 9127]